MDNQISSDIMNGIRCLLKQVCEIEVSADNNNKNNNSHFRKQFKI